MAYSKKPQTTLKDSTIGFALGAFVVLGVFIYSLYSLADWNNPSAAPTGGNVLAPLNASSTTQYKLGSLELGSTTPIAYVSNLFLYNGKEAIGTSTIGVTGLLVANSGHNVNVIDANTNRITNLIQVPLNPGEAASKAYVDSMVGAVQLWSGLTTTNISNANIGYNVGISTTTPPQALSVGSRSAAGGIIQQSSLNGNRNGILFARTSGVVAGIGIDSNNTGLQLFANAATLSDATADLTILANGNVGIGATNPVKVLDVRGDSILYSANGSFSEGANVFYTGAAGTGGGYNLQVGAAGTAPAAGTLKGYMRVRNGGNNNIIFGNYYGGSDHIYMEADNANNNLYLVQSSGNVGIGTTSPPQALSVGSRSAAGGIIQQSSLNGNRNGILFARTSGVVAGIGIDSNNTGLQFFANAATLSNATADLTILANGRVGIGTTSPMTALHVSGGAQPAIRVGGSSGGEFDIAKEGSFYYALVASTVLGTNDLSIYSGVSSHYELVIKQNDNIILNGGGAYGSGNVGIGTTVPGAKLDVRGTGYFSGNVGIATSTSGTYVLDVNGLARFSADVKVGGQVIVNSGDLAEDFYVDKIYPAGTVLVMDDQGYKSARACDKKYDPTVIGVVSEAPGLVIGTLAGQYKAPVALTGVVKVRVNNSGGQINPGDLLTASAVSGEAMKAANPKLGTTLGKALESDTGKGWVMAIVNLK